MKPNLKHDISLIAIVTVLAIGALAITLGWHNRLLGRTASNGYRFVKIYDKQSGVQAWIGQTEVRSQDFHDFLEATGTLFTQANFADKYLESLKKGTGTFSEKDLPMVGVNLWDCLSYASWLTERDRLAGLLAEDEYYSLPSDLEWSAALRQSGSMRDSSKFVETGRSPEERGSADQIAKTAFLWGTETMEFQVPVGNLKASEKQDPANLLPADGFPGLSPVNQRWVSQEKVLNMIGNAKEWCRDEYTSTDGVPPALAGKGVLRGGSHATSEAAKLNAAYRESLAASTRDPDAGFRLVILRELNSDRSLILGRSLMPWLPLALVIGGLLFFRRRRTTANR